MSSDKVKNTESREPGESLRHSAASRTAHDVLVTSPCVHPTPSYPATSPSPSYPSVAKDGVSIFSFNSGTTPAASLIMDVFQHSSPGGTLVAIFDPTTGIIRPVHRAYLCHAHSGEIPLFESHFQRWNISLSEHHSEALTVIEKTVEPPATWKRSLFGPLRGDIKRSIHVFHLFQRSPSTPSTPES